MSKYDSNGQNLDDLLRQVDSLLDDEPEENGWYQGDFRPEDDIDLDEYTPAEAREDSQPIFYQNYSNDYGRQVRNYSNGYGRPQPAPQPEPEPVYEDEYYDGEDYDDEEPEYPQMGSKPTYAQPSIPAYNADFQKPSRPRNTNSQAYKAQQKKGGQDPVRRKTEYQAPPRQTQQYRDYGEPELTGYYDPPSQPSKKPKKQKSHRSKRGCGCGCGPTLLILVALVVGLCFWIFDAPKSSDSIGARKRDTSAVLICGTDKDGTRTDTMMLLYMSGSEKKVGLLSLPRDTYTITSSGSAAKLNSAYGRNNCGEEGMEGLLDYVQDIIGYRPDGYILVDMSLVTQITDLMGGVDVEVPQAMEVDGISLDAGMQHLDGTQVLTLLRFRKGYTMADLTRVEVQRSVIKACLEQWVSLSHVKDVGAALSLVQDNSISDLTTRNYLWMAKTILLNLAGGFTTETLPGYADYVGDQSFYILYRDDVAEMINDSYNPYQVTIAADDLNIAG